MANGRHFKIEKLSYLQNRLADFDESWHCDILARLTLNGYSKILF